MTGVRAAVDQAEFSWVIWVRQPSRFGEAVRQLVRVVNALGVEACDLRSALDEIFLAVLVGQSPDLSGPWTISSPESWYVYRQVPGGGRIRINVKHYPADPDDDGAGREARLHLELELDGPALERLVELL